MLRTAFLIALVLSMICSIMMAQVQAESVKEVYWEDLVPKGFVAPPMPIDHSGNMTQAEPNAPLVEDFNNTIVKIPGFVVPLEGEAEYITEFLLVPYFGACVHVPPPPSNQIVYVIFSEGVPIDNLYDAVWVTGTLSTEGWQGDIASVGYRLTGLSVSGFE